LALESFTGISAEAVRQDFYATVYLSGVESLLTDAAQALLDAKSTKYPQTVNPSGVVQCDQKSRIGFVNER